jgi:hypothetical protein
MILDIENIAQQKINIKAYNKAIKSINKYSRDIIPGQNGNNVYIFNWNTNTNLKIKHELISYKNKGYISLNPDPTALGVGVVGDVQVIPKNGESMVIIPQKSGIDMLKDLFHHFFDYTNTQRFH